MRIRGRTMLAMLAVAVLPLTLGLSSALRVAEGSLVRRAHYHHTEVARLLAEKIGDDLAARRTAVSRAAQTYLFEEMDPSERLGALRLIYRQVDWASAAVLLSAHGRQLTEPVFLDAPQTSGDLEGRAPSSPADIALFGDHLQLSATLELGSSVSPVYFSSTQHPRLSVGARTTGGLVLAVELDLERLSGIVRRPWTGPDGLAMLVDADGHTLLSSSGASPSAAERAQNQALIARDDSVAEIEHPTLGPSLAATALVPGYRYVVVVMEPRASALEAVRLVRTQGLKWGLAALAAGLVLGLLLTHTLVSPLREVHEGAATLGAGDLSHRVAGAERKDELGDLSRAFNQMAAEIQRWNRELEDRVEEKSVALERTQGLLLQAQKMAAVSQLGAGVAHEINNPLAGLLGKTQLLLMKEPKDSRRRKHLEKIELQGQRIKEIVENLKKLADDDPNLALGPADVSRALITSLDAATEGLAQSEVQIHREIEPGLPEVMGSEVALREVFTQIIDNARVAMKAGGVLTVRAGQVQDGLLRVDIEDDGIGIEQEIQGRVFEPFFTTKSDWEAKGLGLSIVSKIVADHHGEVTLHSTPGAGTSVQVDLPTARGRTLQ